MGWGRYAVNRNNPVIMGGPMRCHFQELTGLFQDPSCGSSASFAHEFEGLSPLSSEADWESAAARMSADFGDDPDPSIGCEDLYDCLCTSQLQLSNDYRPQQHPVSTEAAAFVQLPCRVAPALAPAPAPAPAPQLLQQLVMSVVVSSEGLPSVIDPLPHPPKRPLASRTEGRGSFCWSSTEQFSAPPPPQPPNARARSRSNSGGGSASAENTPSAGPAVKRHAGDIVLLAQRQQSACGNEPTILTTAVIKAELDLKPPQADRAIKYLLREGLLRYSACGKKGRFVAQIDSLSL